MEKLFTLRFEGKTEFLESTKESHQFPIGQLLFDILEYDLTPLKVETDKMMNCMTKEYGEGVTVSNRMQNPDTCPYVKVAQFHQFTCEFFKDSLLLQNLFIKSQDAFYEDRFVKPMREQEGLYRLGYNKTEAHIRATGGPALHIGILRKFINDYPDLETLERIWSQTEDLLLVNVAVKYGKLLYLRIKNFIDFRENLSELLEDLVDMDTEDAELSNSARYQNHSYKWEKYAKENDTHITFRTFFNDNILRFGFCSEQIESLAFLELQHLCSNDIKIRRCKRCGKYFLPYSARSQYCTRIVDGDTQKTCKDVAPKENDVDKVSKDEALKLYRKQTNAYQMRCRRAPWRYKKKDYEIWKKDKQELLQKFNAGEMDIDTFEKMLELPEIVK